MINESSEYKPLMIDGHCGLEELLQEAEKDDILKEYYSFIGESNCGAEDHLIILPSAKHLGLCGAK